MPTRAITIKTPTEVDHHVGAQIRKARLAAGLSQERMAEALGVTFQQVQKYEKGANRVSASRLWQLCGVLRVEPGWFFHELGVETRTPAPCAAVASYAQGFVDALRATKAAVRAAVDAVEIPSA